MANKSITSRSPAKNSKLELSILVPVYNEEKTILKILSGVTQLPIKHYEVLVVNDASKDNSKSIIDKFKKNFSSSNVTLRVLEHEKNRGKGAGIKTGLLHAKGKYFVIQDADLEYDPADIPALLNKAEKGNLDAVYGSRFKGRITNMPLPNYYANKFYNFMLRRLYKTTITDMHTCYKLVRTTLLQDLNMTSEGFGYATELVSKLLKRGVEIQEGPINFFGRTKKEGKKIGVKDGVECLWMMVQYRYGKEHETANS